MVIFWLNDVIYNWMTSKFLPYAVLVFFVLNFKGLLKNIMISILCGVNSCTGKITPHLAQSYVSLFDVFSAKVHRWSMISNMFP